MKIKENPKFQVGDNVTNLDGYAGTVHQVLMSGRYLVEYTDSAFPFDTWTEENSEDELC